MPQFMSEFRINDEVSLELLIDALLKARDAKVKGINITKSSMKYNLEIPVREEGLPNWSFRINNIDEKFVKPKNENDFHYNCKVIEASRENVDKLFKEMDTLKQWKAEALEVLNPILDYMRENDPEMRIGENISDRVIMHLSRSLKVIPDETGAL